MADKIWNGTTGNWNVPGNWSPSGVPGTADIAILSGGGTYTVTYNEPSGEISGLVVADPGATLQFVSGDFLNVLGNVELTAGTVNLSESGVLAAGAILDIGSPATVDLGTAANVVAGEAIPDAGHIQGGPGYSILGGGPNARGGTVVAAGGTLALVSDVLGTGLNFEVTGVGSSFLAMAGTGIANNNTFTLEGPAGGVGFVIGSLSENIVGMNVGASVTVATNFIEVAGA